jgi:DNA-binding MarR family transcriptional regulator
MASEVGMASDVDEMTDALLEASRALVAVAARSLTEVDGDLTLAQFRALVILHRYGPLPVTTLAERIGVHQSSATRIAARLARSSLVLTGKSAQDRRLTIVRLAQGGQELVERVLAMRRRHIATVVAELPLLDVEITVAALRSFASATIDGVLPRPVAEGAGTGDHWLL